LNLAVKLENCAMILITLAYGPQRIKGDNH
jgi:hypothetical protein